MKLENIDKTLNLIHLGNHKSVFYEVICKKFFLETDIFQNLMSFFPLKCNFKYQNVSNMPVSC